MKPSLVICCCLYFFCNCCAAQWMRTLTTQMDFRRLLRDKLVDNKWVGNVKSIDSLIVSLKKELEETKRLKSSDSLQLVLLYRLAYCYGNTYKKEDHIDSAFYYERQKLQLARKVKEAEMVVQAYSGMVRLCDFAGNREMEKLSLLKDWMKEYDTWIKYTGSLISEIPHIKLAEYYNNIGDTKTAEDYVIKFISTASTTADKVTGSSYLGSWYLTQKLYDKALPQLEYVINNSPRNHLTGSNYTLLVITYIGLKQYEKALSLIDKINSTPLLNSANPDNNIRAERNSRDLLSAQIYLLQKRPEKALEFLERVSPFNLKVISSKPVYDSRYDWLWYQYYLQTSEPAKALPFFQSYTAKQDTARSLADEYRKSSTARHMSFLKNFEREALKQQAEKEKLLQEKKLLELQQKSALDKKQAVIAQLQATADKDQLTARAKNAELQRKLETERITTNAKKDQLQQQFQIASLNQDLKIQRKGRALLAGGLGMVVLIAGLLVRQNNQKMKANRLLNLQKEEIVTQRDKLEKTLDDLNNTQAQLIQKEKMASLGELTAGIAHEIQNPLNFVNNFSDVNTELLKELKNELHTGNKQEALLLADDIIENEQKINGHGKRADAIVKGMLQHSRASTGKKEPTDINALADEYLRLSFHGFRAKHKDFNADFKTDFDESIGKIEVVPQDIGRVLLNLYNNAFYAVNEKNASTRSAGQPYEPTVSVSTKRSLSFGEGRGEVIISVKDNGNGIPQKIVDKIFQPFFTTKPTGQGTGLGLSLSYDIIKAHGGELTVKTKEARPDDAVGRGEGAEFIIELPVI